MLHNPSPHMSPFHICWDAFVEYHPTAVGQRVRLTASAMKASCKRLAFSIEECGWRWNDWRSGLSKACLIVIAQANYLHNHTFDLVHDR
jgi:hypothetical protein